MKNINLIHTANGDDLLLCKYSNKIYKLSEPKAKKAIIKMLQENIDQTKLFSNIGIENLTKQEIVKHNSYPEIEIILTYKCNMSCEYCWQRKSDLIKEKPMDKETFMNLVNYIKANNTDYVGDYNIGYMGGEPLLMFDFIKWANNYLIEQLNQNLNIRILTNGSIINQEMCDYFSENNIKIIVSLDGSKENNKRRGNFEATIKGIELLTKNNLYPQIQSTLNINYFINGAGIEATQFFLSNNLKDFNLIFEGPLDNYNSNLLYNSYVTILNFCLMWSFTNNKLPSILKQFVLSLILPEESISQCFCRFLYPRGFQIAPNGDVFACEFNKSALSYGNVNDIHNLTKIESNENAFKTSKYNHSLCNNCKFVGLCDGYPMLCSLYKNSVKCPKQQYYKACFDVVYPHIKKLIVILREEEK